MTDLKQPPFDQPFLPPPRPAAPPAPRPPRAPARAAVSVVDPDPRRMVAFALGAGFVLEVGLRGGADNLIVALGILLVVVALLADRRLQRSEARKLALAALAPAAFLAVRASPWLMWSNLAIAAAFLGAAVLYSRSGSVFDTSPGRLLQRSAVAIERAVMGLTIVQAAAPRLSTQDQRRALRIGSALLVSLPVLGVLVALLASADAVFASLLTPETNLGPVGGHLALTLLVAAGVLGLAGVVSGPLADRSPTGGFGVAEVATMLGLAAVVLGMFVVSQLVALTDAGERLVEQAGLTPAEYARSGFFQLCWATGVLLLFLVVVRALAAPEALDHRVVRVMGAAVPLLALGLVAVSLRRMALYDEAFGLTMLRLWVVGAAVWMGTVLVMTAVRNGSRHARGTWLVAGAGVAALTLVLAADAVNPEAFVARHNIERGRDGAELDVDYLAGLSDDAVPTLAAEPEVSEAFICDGGEDDDRGGVAALNLAVVLAHESRQDLCTGG
jgi:Domain of unknown function (DUF4153)